MISKAIAAADLLGIRIYKISAQCPDKTQDERAELILNTSCKLDRVKGRKPSAFAELNLSIDTVSADGAAHRLFDIELNGAYTFASKIDAKLYSDERFVNILCRPLYTAAVYEFRKLSAAMDLGGVYITTELPWPDGLPRDLDEASPVVNKIKKLEKV